MERYGIIYNNIPSCLEDNRWKLDKTTISKIGKYRRLYGHFVYFVYFVHFFGFPVITCTTQYQDKHLTEQKMIDAVLCIIKEPFNYTFN